MMRDDAVGRGATGSPRRGFLGHRRRVASGPAGNGYGSFSLLWQVSARSWCVIPLFLFLTLWVGSAAGAFEIKDSTWEGTSEFLAVARDRIGRARVRVVPAVPWD